MKKTIWMLFIAYFGFLSPAGAQVEDLLAVTVEGKSELASSSEAAAEIQTKVMAEVLRQQIRNLIGDKRLQKNRALIEGKIIRDAAKFIPYLNPGEIAKEADGKFVQKVEMKVSIAGVRNAVLRLGLGSDAEEPVVLLPMIAWNDLAKSTSLRWWSAEAIRTPNHAVSPAYERMHRILEREFTLQGFPMVLPMGTSGALVLPESLRFERPKANDLPLIGDFFNATVLLRGEIVVKPSSKFANGVQAQLRLAAVHMERNRLIAETLRRIELEQGHDGLLRSKFSEEIAEAARELGGQISEAWQKGTIGSSMVQLVYKGSHTPQLSAELKNVVLRSSAQVRAIKERMIESRQLTFEMDFTGSVSELVESLQGQTVASKPLKVLESNDQGLTIGQ